MDEKEFYELCKEHLKIAVHAVRCPDDPSDMVQVCLTFKSKNGSSLTAKTLGYDELWLPYGVRWDE